MVDLSEFKVYHYPDGHKHIVSDKDLHGDTVLSASIRTFDDLFLIAQVRRIHPELTELYIKYLLAGRCDRRFSPGEALDLEIVCDFINSLAFDDVAVLKPHSTKTLQLLKNAYELDVTSKLVRMCENDIRAGNGINEKICYISPDAGASNWIHKYNYSPIIQVNKKRDVNGVVAGIDFNYESSFGKTIDGLQKHIECPNFVIIDDLCDGGGTFIGIAKVIKERSPTAKIYLVVTHAIFSKGLAVFDGHIERIYCTDSWGTFDNPLVKQIKL